MKQANNRIEKGWDKMNILLDQELPIKEKKNRFIWFFILIFLVLSFGIYIFFSKSNLSHQADIVSNESTDAPASKPKLEATLLEADTTYHIPSTSKSKIQELVVSKEPTYKIPAAKTINNTIISTKEIKSNSQPISQVKYLSEKKSDLKKNAPIQASFPVAQTRTANNETVKSETTQVLGPKAIVFDLPQISKINARNIRYKTASQPPSINSIISPKEENLELVQGYYLGSSIAYLTNINKPTFELTLGKNISLNRVSLFGEASLGYLPTKSWSKVNLSSQSNAPADNEDAITQNPVNNNLEIDLNNPSKNQNYLTLNASPYLIIAGGVTKSIDKRLNIVANLGAQYIFNKSQNTTSTLRGASPGGEVDFDLSSDNVVYKSMHYYSQLGLALDISQKSKLICSGRFYFKQALNKEIYSSSFNNLNLRWQYHF